MNDLADKAEILTLQTTTVEASLTKLNQNFQVCVFLSISGMLSKRTKLIALEQNLIRVIDSIESDTDYKEEIDDDSAKALSNIQVAMAAFK